MRVIGIGNPLRGDDAIGLLVARRVRELADPEVEVMELEGEPARLIDAWQGAGLAVVVDAVKTGAPAGNRDPDRRHRRLPATLGFGVLDARPWPRGGDRDRHGRSTGCPST